MDKAISSMLEKTENTPVKQADNRIGKDDVAEYEKLKKQLDSTLPGVDSVKPSQTLSNQGDPPPHEGVMIEYPEIVNPPDVILLEVLKSLPGMPINQR
ncbi:MAG: hypothetical protein ACKO85_11845 [Isosphaeraceae bacterium]